MNESSVTASIENPAVAAAVRSGWKGPSGPENWQQLALWVECDLERTAASVLRRYAARSFGLELQPPDLVNEIYLRLLREHHRKWNDRNHFFSYAAAAMRSVLIDRQRARKAHKRPKGRLSQPLEALLAREEPVQNDPALAVEVRIAVERLRSKSPRRAWVVELHVFGGLGLEEVGGRLGVCERTIRRDWAAAREFLHAELGCSRG